MNWIRRIFFAVLIAVGCAFFAIPPRPRPVVPRDFIEVRYWEKWTGREADQMETIVDEFNDTVGQQKRIHVSYLSMTAVDQKTLLATAAGVPPDVAGIWDTQLKQFAAMGALESLDDRANARGMGREYYKPVFFEGCSYDGHQYAMPSTPGDIALHYNKRIFEQKADKLKAAGLDPNRPPRTIAELDRYAEVLDERDDHGNLISAGFLPQEPGWWLALMPYWFGAKLYDPQTRKITFTDPKVVECYTWVQGYTNRLGAQTVQAFRTTLGKDNFDSPQSPFFTGAVVMEQEGPWKANYIAKLNPRMSNRQKLSDEQLKNLSRNEIRDNTEWAAAPFPTVSADMPPVTYGGMDVLVIPNSSHHKDEAFEFLAFVNRQDVMEKLVSMHCKDSPLAKMSPDYIKNHPNPYIEVFEKLAESPGAQPLPSIPIWPEVRAELDDAAERICLGVDTPQHALAEAQTRAQAKVDRFFQRMDQRSR